MDKLNKSENSNAEGNRAVVIIGRFYFKCIDLLFKVLGWFFIVITLKAIALKIGDSFLFTVFAEILFWAYFSGISIWCLSVISASKSEMGLPESKIGTIL